MTRCQVTTGFFVLRRCGQPTAAWCGGCRRPICAAHTTGTGLCPECAASHDYGNDPHSAGWLPRYRRHYYDRSSRKYHDTTWYSSFSASDRRAFDNQPHDAYGDDHDDDAMLDS